MRKGLVTTNEQKPTGPVEPQKLNVITTAIIPEAKPMPVPKGTDLSKMITTHDMGAEAQAQVAPGEEDVKLVPAPTKDKKAGRPKKD